MLTDPTAPITHARLSQPVLARGGFAEGGEDPRATVGEGELTFTDLLQTINPLHHLPVIGTMYREMTGEHLAPVARVIGGGLFGGIFGLLSGIGNAVVEALSGRDIGGHVASLFSSTADTQHAKASGPSRAYERAAALAAPDLSRGDTVNMLS